jgi:type IV secretory pathway VirB9-like protein
MSRFCFALLAASALASPATAASDPAMIRGANDTRIRTVDYSERVVTNIVSTDLVPITITYGDGEIPKLVAGLKVVVVTPKEGADAKAAQDAAAGCADWCADHHANDLTLQPLKTDAGSMLVVTTEKPGDNGGPAVRHHYAYQLSTRIGTCTGKGPDCTDADTLAYFRVSYTYSAEDRAKAVATWQVSHKDDLAAKAHQKVQDRLAVAQFGGPRNYKWTKGDSQDCAVLAPARLSDNGQMTTLYFPMNTPISVPNRIEPDGSESLLDWHPEKAPDSGDMMVLHSVPAQFVLRRDKLVCLFVRDPKAPWQVIPNTGTATPDVVRETRK